MDSLTIVSPQPPPHPDPPLHVRLHATVLEHKIFTGSLLSRPAAFKKLLDDALKNASVREYFEGRTAASVRNYWAKMKREHAAAEKESSASGSSVQLPGDADYAAWVSAGF